MRWWPSSARGATRSSRAWRGSRAFAVTSLPAPSTPFPTCARFLSARPRSRIGCCKRKRSRCSMERASVRVDRDTFASRSQLRWRTWKKPRTGSRAWSPGSSGQSRCVLPRLQPAVTERSGRFGRILEVPARDVLSLSHDFTRLARRDRATLLVHHAERDAGDTLADAGRPSIDLVRIEDRQARRRLRGTVHEIETHRRFRLAQLADEGYLKLPAGLLEPAEVGKLHLLEARFAQEDLVVARHAGEAGAARLDH